MTGFLLRRLLGAIPTLFVIVTATFFLIRLAPGGPFDQEQRLPPEIQANLEAAYGLDQPMLVQYGRYLSGLARGDFGPSFKYRDFDVTELIGEGLPISVSLGLSAVLLAVALGVPFGTFAALRRDQWPDHALRALALIGIAIPGFVIAPILALVFGIYLQWLPVAGWEPGTLTDAILPVVSLALPLSAFVARLMRASMIEVLSANFIRSARARGLSHWRIVLHHALRPALLPVVSYLGPATAAVLTGSLVVETIFGIPGMGRYLVQGALNRDYTLVMGMVIVFASLTILLNLLVDLLYGWLDPRIRAQGARSP